MTSEINHAKGWKYAHREFERRFLISRRPTFLQELRYKEISDKYIIGTNLRLREIRMDNEVQYKLTKKIDTSADIKHSHWISTIYLSQKEFKVLWKLAGNTYQKRRYYYPDKSGMIIGIDEIQLKDKLIWIAEAEFNSSADMDDFQCPIAFSREVTNDPEFSGYELAKRSSEIVEG